MNKLAMMLMLALAFFQFPVDAIAGPATDRYWQARANHDRACAGKDVSTDRACRQAFMEMQNAGNAMQTEAWSNVESQRLRKQQVQQEEAWRAEMYRYNR